MDIKVESQRALKSLRYLRPTGLFTLTAMHPTQGISSITRDIGSSTGQSDLLDFLVSHNGSSNLYFNLNEPKPGLDRVKLSKDDIGIIHGLYIDADPDRSKPFEEERQRLLAFADSLSTDPLRPNLIVDSGGGIQAFWLFDTGIESTDQAVYEIERYGRGLAHKYGTDSVHNVDRLMRVPYTMNLPSFAKQQTGRLPALSRALHKHDTYYTSLKGLCEPVDPPPSNNDLKGVDGLDYDALVESYSDIPEELKTRYEELLEVNAHLRNMHEGKTSLPSRSEYDLAVAGVLKNAGWSLQDTAQIMYVFKWGKGTELRARDIVRAYNNAADIRAELALPKSEVERIAAQTNPLDKLVSDNEDKGNNSIPLDKDGKPDYLNMKLQRLVITESWEIDPLNDDVDWLFDDLIMEGGFGVLFGRSGAGKSFSMLDIAVHLAWGKDWNGYNCVGKRAVIYNAAEAGKSIGKRVEAARRRAGVPKNVGLSEFPFRMVNMSTDMLCKGKDLHKQVDVNDMIIACKQLEHASGHRMGVVVFDTLSATFAGGNENASDDLGRYVNNIKRINEEGDTGTIIVHHAGKDETAGARGHSLLNAATDTEIEIRADKKIDPPRRSLRVSKQKEGEEGQTHKFTLNTVEIGLNKRGKMITSCQTIFDNDSEFESVIPNVLEELTLIERAMYVAIYVANERDENVVRKINGWFGCFLLNPDKLPQNLSEMSQFESDTFDVIDRRYNGRKNTPNDIRTRLQEKNLIRKNELNQWFII